MIKKEKTKVSTISCRVTNEEKEEMVLCQDLVQVKMRNFSPF